jgi:hypothetical protein
VTQVAGGSASGITVGSISNSNGTVSATLAAACRATAGTVRFEVSDGSLAGSSDLQVNVSLNTPPTLGQYLNTKMGLGQAAQINPDAAPADNGSIDGISTGITPDTFAGTLHADPATGEISVGQAAPVGAYTVTVTITDNCGATIDRDMTLEVLADGIFSDSFETP